jgi:hypothetical protein
VVLAKSKGPDCECINKNQKGPDCECINKAPVVLAKSKGPDCECINKNQKGPDCECINKAPVAKEVDERVVAKMVAAKLYTKKHPKKAPAKTDRALAKVERKVERQEEGLAKAHNIFRKAKAAAKKLEKAASRPEKPVPKMGLVYLWSAPLMSWGQEVEQRAPPRNVALLSRATKVKAYAADAMPYQDVGLTADEVAAEKDVNLHISDDFADMATADQEAEQAQKLEDKHNKYDPVAAVKTDDLEPRLRDNVELHDIFADLESQDEQVDNELARLGDNANFGAVRGIEDASMKYLESAQTAPVDRPPSPLSWTDTDPEGAIKLHEPFAALEHADRESVRETERRPDLKLIQLH